MKSALFALALITSTSAHALKVGDSSVYTGTTDGQAFTYSMTVTQINGDTYSANSVISIQGQTQSGVATGSINELSQTADIFQNCASYGGNFETVTTPARAFNTCHVSYDGGEINVTNEVPFGFVKSLSNENGNRIEMLLQSFIMN